MRPQVRGEVFRPFRVNIKGINTEYRDRTTSLLTQRNTVVVPYVIQPRYKPSELYICQSFAILLSSLFLYLVLPGPAAANISHKSTYLYLGDPPDGMLLDIRVSRVRRIPRINTRKAILSKTRIPDPRWRSDAEKPASAPRSSSHRIPSNFQTVTLHSFSSMMQGPA